MPSLPNDPSCVIRAGETVELRDDDVMLPDGSTRADLTDCDLQSGAILVIPIAEPMTPRKTRHPLPSVTMPLDVSDVTEPIDAPFSQTAESIKQINHRLPPEMGLQPAVVAAAVAIVASVGWVAAKAAMQNVRGSSGLDGQQAENERKRRERCTTASDDLVIDFRARVADFRYRQLREPAEPTELWHRCDVLDEQADRLQRWLRARAKTRRA